MDYTTSAYIPEKTVVKSMVLTYSMFSICFVNHFQSSPFVIVVVCEKDVKQLVHQHM